MKIETTISSQNINDLIKMIDKQYPPQLEQEEKIKIAIAFGQALSNNKEEDYYKFIKEFEKNIERLL